MIETSRQAIGATALVILVLFALVGSIAFVQHRYGDNAGAALFLGYVAGGLCWLAAWGLG